MEVAVPPPAMDFDFNDPRPLPVLSAPSSPKRFGDISFSTPTSPSRILEFYRRFDSSESVPASPKSLAGKSSTGGESFAFDFRSELEKNSLYAEELFHGGKIRPLLVEDQRSPLLSPRSPRSPIVQGKKIIRQVFSPRKKNQDSDRFAIAAAENTLKRTGNDRGRERSPGLGSSSSHRATRSLSPLRVSEYPWEEEEEERRLQEITAKQSQSQSKSAAPNSKPSNSSSNTTTKSSSRKWRLKDFLLFRSASEGRASDKDIFGSKYSSFYRKQGDAKSTDSSPLSGSRRKGQVSAHELHYTTNKAASEDLKKKTFLPYKQGILGRLAFSPTAHVLVNGFGNIAR